MRRKYRVLLFTRKRKLKRKQMHPVVSFSHLAKQLCKTRPAKSFGKERLGESLL